MEDDALDQEKLDQDRMKAIERFEQVLSETQKELFENILVLFFSIPLFVAGFFLQIYNRSDLWNMAGFVAILVSIPTLFSSTKFIIQKRELIILTRNKLAQIKGHWD